MPILALIAFTLLFIGGSLVAAVMLPAQGLSLFSHQPLFIAHLLIALLAYSLLTLAALLAVLLMIMYRWLHDPAHHPRLASLPPLLSLERLMFQVVHAGFILLTLTLISGGFFSEILFGQAMKWTHKTVFGLTSWGIFAGLLTGHHLQGWRGRRAVRYVLSGFFMLVLAYIGSKFVLEVLLGR